MSSVKSSLIAMTLAAIIVGRFAPSYSRSRAKQYTPSITPNAGNIPHTTTQ